MATAAGVVFTMTQAALFAELMRKQCAAVPRRGLAAAFLLSQPGKYVPGKVWSPLLQAFVLRNAAPFGGIAIANVELAAIATLQVTALGVASLYARSPLVAGCALGTGLLTSALIAMLPTGRLISRTFPRLASTLKVASSGGPEQRGRFSRMLWLCAAGIAANFVASYLVLVAAEATIPLSMRTVILGTLYLGFAVSMLAVPVPAGLGIREAAAAAIGSLAVPDVPASLIVSAAVFFRGWQIFVDLACLATGVAMARWRSATRSGPT